MVSWHELAASTLPSSTGSLPLSRLFIMNLCAHTHDRTDPDGSEKACGSAVGCEWGWVQGIARTAPTAS